MPRICSSADHRTFLFRMPIGSETLLRMARRASYQLLLTFYFFLLPAGVHAETTPKSTTVKRPIILHVQPKVSDLPNPGSPMTLKVRLKNTKDTDHPIRALVTRDGRLTDFEISSGRFNDNEEIEYEVSFPSPLAELVYQFAYFMNDGDAVSSPRYELRRKCIPNISLAADELSPTLKADDKLRAMVGQAKDLERDDENFQRIIGLINDIKQILETR